MNQLNQHQHPVSAPASRRASRRGRVHRALCLGLLVASCGCVTKTTQMIVKRDAMRSSTSELASNARLVAANEAKHKPAAVHTARISDDSLAANSTSMKTVEASGNASVMPVSYDEPLAEMPVQTSIVDPCRDQADQVACNTTDGVCNSCAPEMPCGPMGDPLPQYWNDQEYIYDGGDRDPRVQVSPDWRVSGLNSQDTVAHYETLEGKLCVSPSNRVPIYAPRFGAVRKSTVPILQAGAVGARGMLDPRGPSVKASNEPVGDLALPQGPKLRDAIAPIDSLRDRTRGVGAEKIIPPIDLTGYQMALRRLQSHGSALRREDLLALIGEYMVNARTWVSPEGLSIAMSGVAATQVRDAKEVQDITVYETEPGKCSLRICKAASHSAANPGDIVSFSIRFENIGCKPIGNLVILDSLVSRLEYIDGTQQCILSLASNKTPDKDKNPIKFSTAENEAGSTVLRWESDLPLETADSGVITFRCRVR